MSALLIYWKTLGIIVLLASVIIVSVLNPVARLCFQIIVYLAGSQMYTILDFYYLGQTYIIVYVGAIAILFQFVIMMIPVGGQGSSPALYVIAVGWALMTSWMSSTLLISWISFKSEAMLGMLASPYEACTYFNPNYAISFVYFTDIQTQAYTVYFAYPQAQLLIAVAQWAVQIGIIAITSR